MFAVCGTWNHSNPTYGFSWITVSRPGALTEQGWLFVNCCYLTVVHPLFAMSRYNKKLLFRQTKHDDHLPDNWRWWPTVVLCLEWIVNTYHQKKIVNSCRKQPNARSNFLALNFFRIQTCTDIPSKEESYTDKRRCKVDSSFLRGPFNNTSLAPR